MIEPPPGEELVPQVDRNAGVPDRDRDTVHVVATIVRRVVDENADRTEVRSHAFDCRLQRDDVAQVDGNKQGIVRTVPGQRRRKGLARIPVDIQEADLGGLFDEMRDDAGADATCAAGDEDDAIGEAGIARER